MPEPIVSGITWEMPRDCWPTPQQELLLCASTFEGSDAIKAWRKWRSLQDIDAMDYGSFRLLPLLYKNLVKLEVDDVEMKRLKGVYRLAWVKNQILVDQGTKLLSSFHEAGIRTMVLKGAALLLRYYKDMGTRPMADFDMMIPPDKVKQATSYLTEEGWTPSTLVNSDIGVYHGCNFTNKKDLQIDLHWHLLEESCFPGGDDSFWDGSVPLNIKNFSTLMLNPADQLLHICGHGIRWNPVPPIRWVADADAIIKTSGNDLDWERLVRHAETYTLVSCLATGLTYIKGLLNSEIPESVLRALSALPVSRIDRVTFKARTRNLHLVSPLPACWNHYKRHARMTGDIGTLRRLLRFPGYLQARWGLNSTWHVPCYFISKGFVRMAKIMKSRLGIQV